MKKYYTTEQLDETIILSTVGGEVDGRIWCTGLQKKDKTHRMRKYDGFYDVNKLKKIH